MWSSLVASRACGMDAAASGAKRWGAGRIALREPRASCRTSGAVRIRLACKFRLRRQGWEYCGEMAGRAYGKTVWSWPSLLRSSCCGGGSLRQPARCSVNFARVRRPKGTRLPGEHGISRPTIALGRPSDWLHLYAAVRFSCAVLRAADPQVPAGTRPSLCPLGSRGWSDEAKLGRNSPREREGASGSRLRFGHLCLVPNARDRHVAAIRLA